MLLVEDEAIVRKMVRTALEMSGFNVVEAGSAEEALSIVLHQGVSPDLLLTDVVMPKISGREVAEQLRGCLPGLKVLFMSGYTDDVVVRHGVLHAEAHFIQKPFSLPDLARKVRDVLDAKALP